MANLEMLKNLSAVYEHMEEVIGKSQRERKELLSICEEMEENMVKELLDCMTALGQYAKMLIDKNLGRVFFTFPESISIPFGTTLYVCFESDGSFIFYLKPEFKTIHLYVSSENRWVHSGYEHTLKTPVKHNFALHKDEMLSFLEGAIAEKFEKTISEKLDSESEKANNLMIRYELLKQIKNEEGDNT